MNGMYAPFFAFLFGSVLIVTSCVLIAASLR